MLNNVKSLGQITNNFLNQQKNNREVTAAVASAVPKVTETPKQGEYIHPIITKDDYRETIANYNRYIKQYNMEVWLANAQVRDYNVQVIRFRKQSTIPAAQKIIELEFKERNKHLPPITYNDRVEAYNTKNGLYLRKKNLRKEVKPGSEKVFVAILHQLNHQLFRRKDLHQELGIHIPTPVPQVSIYPNKIINEERDGYVSLPVSEVTFRHHRERMQEAGVLLDYEFRGSKRAVKMRLNPEILVVTDNGIPKSARTENQQVKRGGANKVSHSNVSSRKYLDKDKLRGIRNFATKKESEEGGKMNINCTGASTGTPKRRDDENFATGGRKMPEISKNLLQTIEPAEDLAQKLARGDYDTYQRINTRAAEKEALHGAMSQDDFKEMAIQDIFCVAAVLFSNLDVHPGSWVNAMKIWKAEKFNSPNGYTLSKPNILVRWQKALQVLEGVKKFQKTHPEWEIRYPSVYFDPQRKDPYESSFEYALRRFRFSEKPTESKQQRKLKHLQNSRKNTDLKKAQDKIRQYLNGVVSLDAVYEYVQQNCNATIWKNVNNIIKKEFNRAKNN